MNILHNEIPTTNVHLFFLVKYTVFGIAGSQIVERTPVMEGLALH